MKRFFATLVCSLCGIVMLAQDYTRYVDPRIGSVGVGRTFLGPSMPYGMAKPGPDAVSMQNAGWAPMPEPLKGFSQTHVSGTGGGQKYGNILIQPFMEGTPAQTVKVLSPKDNLLNVPLYAQRRTKEDVALGYYACRYEDGIQTEVTTAERCGLYRIAYPQSALERKNRLLVDVTSFLGMDTIPGKREAQQYVNSFVKQVDGNTLQGWTTVRGGWNNGGPYTVYFCLQSDVPFSKVEVSDSLYAVASFSVSKICLKVGISFVSMEKAAQNITANDFDKQRRVLAKTWNEKLCQIDITATEKQKRMFYTGIYHTMLMPTDKAGENPHFSDTPYYDDYYAIWDTYRTSMPLLTLIDQDRQRDMVNALLNIYKHDGYMPDARSGNWNGRTQGGSNAEIVIADAFAKGLRGIDYRLALKAMVKDAEVVPDDAEKHGRGGLVEYNKLGYIPYGIDRAGNRTVEYSYADWCIAQVAKGLGKNSLYKKYMKRSANWRNLWRADYEWQGMKGFIMPRDKDGKWLDSVPWGKSKVFHPQIPYRPDTKVAPWYLPWWSTFFYEALSAEYSLSIPHDVPGLIEACGGKQAFIRRLDTFFANGHYNVANEPSFLTPYLYHWANRPELSVERIHQIVEDNYSDAPDGLPGNDDSGAMSSWLVFNMMGIYPVAGQNLYVVGSPMIPSYTLHLPNGKDLKVEAAGEGWTRKFLTHDDLLQGGTLVLPKYKYKAVSLQEPACRFQCRYVLNRQYRNWDCSVESLQADTLVLKCNDSYYRIPANVVRHAAGFCWESPQKGENVYNAQGTFLFISQDALASLLSKGYFIYDGITWRKTSVEQDIVTVQADIDQTIMRISTKAKLPWVLEMRHNPLGIDWQLVGSDF